MPDDVPTPVSASAYTPAQRLSRIRIYVWTAILTSLVGGIVHLSALSDEQLAHMSIMRWVLTLLVLLLSPALEGLNALRAAIDRSTSGPQPGETDAVAAPGVSAAPAADVPAKPVHSISSTPVP